MKLAFVAVCLGLVAGGAASFTRSGDFSILVMLVVIALVLLGGVIWKIARPDKPKVITRQR